MGGVRESLRKSHVGRVRLGEIEAPLPLATVPEDLVGTAPG